MEGLESHTQVLGVCARRVGDGGAHRAISSVMSESTLCIDFDNELLN